jgi:hypothetical protein
MTSVGSHSDRREKTRRSAVSITKSPLALQQIISSTKYSAAIFVSYFSKGKDRPLTTTKIIVGVIVPNWECKNERKRTAWRQSLRHANGARIQANFVSLICRPKMKRRSPCEVDGRRSACVFNDDQYCGRLSRNISSFSLRYRNIRAFLNVHRRRRKFLDLQRSRDQQAKTPGKSNDPKCNGLVKVGQPPKAHAAPNKHTADGKQPIDDRIHFSIPAVLSTMQRTKCRYKCVQPGSERCTRSSGAA